LAINYEIEAGKSIKEEDIIPPLLNIEYRLKRLIQK